MSDYAVDFWQEDSGLPANYVYSIVQTRDAYLWLGTRGGLGRFDGVRFVAYDDRLPGQLRESEVWTLAEDNDGSLWIGTFGGGLSFLRKDRFSTLTTADGLPSDFVSALCKAPDGTLWIGTHGGLARLRQDRLAVYRKSDGLPGDRVEALRLDPEGVLWIGTDGGLASLANGRIVNHAASDPLLSHGTECIVGSGREGLWIATRNGLIHYRDGSARRFGTGDGLAASYVMALVLEPSGVLWIGTHDGLFRYYRNRFETFFRDVTRIGAQGTLETVSLREIQSLCVDREGSLWIGTRYDGLARLREASFSSTAGAAAESSAPVASVYEDSRGAMWFASGESVRRLKDGSSTAYRLGAEPTTFAEDRDGSVWIGATRLFRYRDGQIAPIMTPDLPSARMTVLFADSQGVLWIGSSSGLFRYSQGGLKQCTIADGLTGSQVRGIAEDRQGNLWICTRDGGVSRLAAAASQSRGTAQGLSRLACQAILVDRDDTVWAATRRGLSRIRDGQVAAITAAHGLPANYFYQIIEDDHGYLWLTYARGVLRVSRSELNAVADGKAKAVTVASFGTEHGMRTSVMIVPGQPTAVKARDGRLWFATMRGPIVLNPANLSRNSVPPPARIEEIAVDGALRSRWADLSFPPGMGNVEIHYTGLSFVAPKLVRFKCILEGFDRGWQDMGTRRVAYYTNLPPRSYRFRVIAFNNDGVPSAEEASVAFRLSPHWHETVWARTLLLACVMVLIGVAYNWRLRQISARQKELALWIDERTQALQSEIDDHRQTEARLQDQMVERKRVEEEARRLNEELEARVAQRTAELARAVDDLTEAHRALEEDIARRVGVEEALAAEKERLAVTLRSIGDGVIATDTEGRIGLMNRAAEELTNWPQKDAAGRPLSSILRLVDPVSRNPLPDLVAAVVRGGGTASLPASMLLLTHDGREIAVAGSVAPIRDPESRVRGAVIAFHDVSERLRTEEQMQKAQKLETLGILAGGIAHDFNNLLAGIFGHIEIARHHLNDKSRMNRALERACDVIDRARGLTGQLLTFTRAGTPDTHPIALGELLRAATRFALSGSNVSCQLDVPVDLWACQADESQIEQVVDNLLLNARHAMPEGGTVTIRARNRHVRSASRLPLPAGRFVEIEVIDTGIGIPPENLARVFDPFFTTKPGGSGLGLTTADSIIKKHGGHIELHSEVRTGTTFTFYLPATEEAPGLARAKTPPLSRGEGRVLVMDDDEHVRDIARGMLEDLGYVVDVARDGTEAVAAFQRAAVVGFPFDMVILDLTVPGGTGGVGTLARLKEITPDVRAVASSGYASDPIMSRPSEFGFAATLPKPYTSQELAKILRSVLATGSARSRGKA